MIMTVNKGQKEVEKDLETSVNALKEQKKVKITIPRDRNNAAKHVWVCVNGQEYYLAVGKELEVPEEVARVWTDSYNKTIEAEYNMDKFNEI